MTYHRRLDHHPDVELDHEGDHAGIGKVDRADWATRFGKHVAELQLDDL
jgi:hypothetical protein